MKHAERTRNIQALRKVLTTTPYSGYDVIIVSSSTPDEARYQQDLLERAFGEIETSNLALDNRVLILSVEDPTEGGQLLGQAFTWLRAVERAHDAGFDLESIAARGAAKIAIYHNGGKGERASPLTQGLGNSRGSQRLVGTIPLSDGSQSELELLLAVTLQTAALADTSDGSALDTFWTSQLLFDAKPVSECQSSGAALEKFLVRVSREDVTPKQLHDFGTALLRPDGTVETFFGNKQFGRRNASDEWEFVEDRRADWDVEGFELAFDFGSFRTRIDLHLDLMRYYDRGEAWLEVAQQGHVSKSRARDIDPHLMQPLVAIVGALACKTDIVPPSVHAKLRELGADSREDALEAAIDELQEKLAPAAEEAFAKAKPEGLRDALGFFLLYGDRSYFADLRAVVGSILFEPESYWLTFRRPIDIGNEKFQMLADLTGSTQTILANGRVDTVEATDADRQYAADVRLLRGIEDHAVCRFRVGDTEHELSADQVREGVEVAGVFVKGSVIAGNSCLHPGSRVENSVLNNVVGRVECETSYVESASVSEITATASVVHKCVDPGRLNASSEVVSDAFRENLRDDGFPEGQVRLRAPVGYDPQAKVEADGKTHKQDELALTEGGCLSFSEVRSWPSARAKNDALEKEIRLAVEESAQPS